jgi:glutamyl-tRNA reductase
MTPNAIAVANRTELLGETGAEVVFVCGEVRSRTDIATGQISVSVRAWILAVSPSLGAAQRAVLGLAQIGVFDVCRPIPGRQELLRRGMPIGVMRFGLLHG